MRLTICAVLLSTGTAAFGQTAAPVKPQLPWLAQPGLPAGSRDFTKLPPDWHITSPAPGKTIIQPGPSPLHNLDAPQMDAEIIVHPPPSSLGEQRTGPLLAQNLYPGLQLMPIDEPKAKGEPIPTTWPNAKIKQIPIAWPKLEISPVQSDAKKPAAEK